MNVNNDDEYHKALKWRQEKCPYNNDTHKDSKLFSQASTVMVQMEGMDPWMDGMIIEGNSKDQQGWLYSVQVMKMGWAIIQNTKHIKHTPVTIEWYLWDQLKKPEHRHWQFLGPCPNILL